MRQRSVTAPVHQHIDLLVNDARDEVATIIASASVPAHVQPEREIQSTPADHFGSSVPRKQKATCCACATRAESYIKTRGVKPRFKQDTCKLGSANMQSTLFFHCRLSALGIFAALTLSVASAAEPTSSAASADAGAPGVTLEEITITAQKRSENLQDVPISVEAFRADALDAAAISTTADLDVVTPGLETGSEFGWAQPHLRGIGTISVDPGVESPVAMYVDGVYYSSLAGGVLALNNVEQIEVDKGPQGTLFGRNATGGLIQITTKDPTQNFSGQVGLTYGNYNTGGGDVYISGGITPSIAADVAVYVNDQGTGYGTNYFTGIEVNKTSENAIRSKWIFNAPDNTEVKLILDYEQTNFSPVALPAPGTTPLGGSPYTGSPQGLDGYYQPYGLE